MAGVITTTTKQAPKTDYQRHWLFAESDDRAMLKQIEETHFPDNREFDVKPIIQIIEDILRRATPSFDGVPKVLFRLRSIFKFFYEFYVRA